LKLLNNLSKDIPVLSILKLLIIKTSAVIKACLSFQLQKLHVMSVQRPRGLPRIVHQELECHGGCKSLFAMAVVRA
jgi:hypothetical protein